MRFSSGSSTGTGSKKGLNNDRNALHASESASLGGISPFVHISKVSISSSMDGSSTELGSTWILISFMEVGDIPGISLNNEPLLAFLLDVS
jgi:hypothetical protein